MDSGGDAAYYGIMPSVFNLGNWLWRGVVRRVEFERAWRRGENWTTYGTEVVRDMPMAFQALGLSATAYNAFNADEADFVDGSYFRVDTNMSLEHIGTLP